MRFGPGLGVHVRHREALAPACIGTGGEILPQRLLDLDGQGVLPFDPVRVVRVHRPQQGRDREHHARVRATLGGQRQTLQVVRLFEQTVATVGRRQQGLELATLVVHEVAVWRIFRIAGAGVYCTEFHR